LAVLGDTPQGSPVGQVAEQLQAKIKISLCSGGGEESAEKERKAEESWKKGNK
jgi:hypothetical protein